MMFVSRFVGGGGGVTVTGSHLTLDIFAPALTHPTRGVVMCNQVPSTISPVIGVPFAKYGLIAPPSGVVLTGILSSVIPFHIITPN